MLTVLLAAAMLGAPPDTPLQLRDDFSAYAEGTEPGAPWFAEGLWVVQSGKLHGRGVGGDLRLRDERWFRRVRVEATITVRRAHGTGWKIVGLGIFHDAEHFWHAALVEGPDPDRRHFFELNQRQPGRWPASDGATVIVANNPGYDWQYDRPYRVAIELRPGEIRAQLTETDGTLRSEIAHRLSDPAVQDGSPVLRCSAFEADFDDVAISASDVAGSPEEIAMQRPPVQVPTLPQVRGQATGFFHVEKHGDVWWVIAPNGEGFYAIGTDHCRFSGHWCEKLGYAPYERVARAKYGTPERWAEEATRRLKSWNFNLIGAGGDPAARYRGLAHTEFISFGTSYAAIDPLVKQVHWTGFPNVFSPDWPRWCDKLAYRFAKANRDDPWLFGYFLDNELEWFGKTGRDVGLAIEAAKLPPDNPAHIALIDLLKRRHGTIEALNQAWGATYASWEDLAAAAELTGTNDKAVHDDLMAFVAEAADLYFRVTAEALKRHDPNHMNLGCRFAGWAPEPAWQAAGKYCDIVTFNYYGGVDLDTETADGLPDTWIKYHRLCGRPMMITEWSFPALDSGLPCTAGAGMRVDTQEQKARCYEIYQRLIFSLPFMVGSDYFMYLDEPALGISSTFPEDSNYGLINEQDEPYEVLTATATRVNAMAYWLHSGLAPDVEVRQVQRRDGKIQALVANMGGSEAECDIVFVVNGQRTERAPARIGAGKQIWVSMARSPRKPAFVRAIADPGRKLAEKRWDNNHADLVDAAAATWPKPPAGKWLARLPAWASTGTLGFAESVVVSVPADALKGFGQAQQLARRLLALDAEGKPLPCQLEAWADGWRVAVRLPALPANSGIVFAIYLTDTDVLSASAWKEISHTTFDLSDDESGLVLTGAGRGGVVDEITWKGKPMGRLVPLVWQQRRGENLWVQPETAVAARVFIGPVRPAAEVTCEARPQADVITAVDEQGRRAPQRASPQPFRTTYRLWLDPGRPWFVSQFVSLQNLDDEPMTVGAYFYYLLSNLGGDAADDQVGGPRVPFYYLRFGLWRDEAAGLAIGAAPAPDPRMSCYFWKDPGGSQHPDLARKFDPPLEIAAGAEFREQEPAAPVFVFVGPDAPGVWREALENARALAQLKVGALPLEKP